MASALLLRKAFVMSVDPTKHEEYKKRHDELWPDLRAELDRAGVRTYSIFLHPGTSQLFAYAEIESEERWAAVASTDACKRWWAFMGDIMPHNDDNSPKSVDLTEVFHIESSSSSSSS